MSKLESDSRVAVEHPERSELAAFLDGSLAAEARRRVVRHLLAGCEECRHEIGGLWRNAEDHRPRRQFSAPLGAYVGAFETALSKARTLRASLEAEREQAPRRVAELLALSPLDRIRRCHEDPRLANPAVIEGLLAERSRRPQEGVALAELAIALAERVERFRYGSTTPRDLETRAWCHLGEARREDGDLVGAERALDLAEALFDQGSEDPLDRAALDLARARWFARMGRAQSAADSCSRAVAILRRVGPREALATVLLELGPQLAESGSPEAAIEALLEGVKDLSAARHSRRLAIGLCTLASLLVAHGRERHARPHLWRARALAERLGNLDILERVAWVEGRAALASGRVDAAEAALLESRDRLSARGLAREALAANLDLAELHLRGGRPVDVSGLRFGPSNVASSSSRPSSGEVAAVLFLRSVVESGGATPDIARDLSDWIAARAAREAASVA